MKFMGVRRQFALGTQFHPELPVTHRASASALSKIIPSFVLATRKRR
jgi:gamma-glutamyl-gamma-aminobutyrate hydrolase PuuD